MPQNPVILTIGFRLIFYKHSGDIVIKLVLLMTLFTAEIYVDTFKIPLIEKDTPLDPETLKPDHYSHDTNAAEQYNNGISWETIESNLDQQIEILDYQNSGDDIYKYFPEENYTTISNILNTDEIQFNESNNSFNKTFNLTRDHLDNSEKFTTLEYPFVLIPKNPFSSESNEEIVDNENIHKVENNHHSIPIEEFDLFSVDMNLEPSLTTIGHQNILFNMDEPQHDKSYGLDQYKGDIKIGNKKGTKGKNILGENESQKPFLLDVTKENLLHLGLNPNIEITIEVIHGNMSTPFDEDLVMDLVSTIPSYGRISDTEVHSNTLSIKSSLFDDSIFASGDPEHPIKEMIDYNIEDAKSTSEESNLWKSREKYREDEEFYSVQKGILPLQNIGVTSSKPDEPATPFNPVLNLDDIAQYLKLDSEEPETFHEDIDLCGKWMNCNNTFLLSHLEKLSKLPSCPCSYPLNLAYDPEVWDWGESKYFNWRDASGQSEALDIYKPGAKYCIRSLINEEGVSLAAQHCCYDRFMRLITRGKGAGTPNLISPEVSVHLHYQVDILPWIICNGDWTRFNQVRPPNNIQNCSDNPEDDIFLQEIKHAKEY